MQVLSRKLNKDKTRKSYSRVAWMYNYWSKMTESRAAQKVIELADITDGQDIADIACGTGMVFKEIVARNPHGNNLGIDLSPAMLLRAKKLLEAEHKGNYTLMEGDILQLDVEDNSFDTVVNNFMIDLMPEETFDTIISEFFRILKPGGIAVISVFSPGTTRSNRMWGWIAKYFPDLLTGCRPVVINENLERMGFKIESEIEISQNTFPSTVYKARKD